MDKTFPYSYLNKKICKTRDAKVPIQCKALQYGLGSFTGIRGYWVPKDKNLYLFRLEDHYARLKNSAKILRMKFDLTYPKFQKIIIDLIKKNRIKEDIYIRPTLYCASTAITPRLGNPDDDLAIYIISLKDYFSSNKGLNVLISSWRRVEETAIPIKAKPTGAYINSALAKTEALDKGFDEAIFLNQDKTICEATGANIFGITSSRIFTPPLTANNLDGITRRSVIEILKKHLRLPVQEKSITMRTLRSFDELFITGTAAKITFIRSVDRRLIAKGKKGPITKEIEKIFNDITSNTHSLSKKWLLPVY